MTTQLCDTNVWLALSLSGHGSRMVTTDAGFRKFTELDLVLLGEPLAKS